MLARRFPVLLTPQANLDWLDSYGTVVSISEYSREWVQRCWGWDDLGERLRGLLRPGE